MKLMCFKWKLVLAIFLSGGLTSCQISPYPNKGLTTPVNPAPPPNILVNQYDALAALEQSVFIQVNQYRQSQSLPPLRWNNRISQQCRIHSQEMATKKIPVSHEGFQQRVESISITLPAQKSAENVAYNRGYQDPVTQAVKGWINSPGHQKNMVGDFNYTGVGVATNSKGEYFLTQIFVFSN